MQFNRKTRKEARRRFRQGLRSSDVGFFKRQAITLLAVIFPGWIDDLLEDFLTSPVTPAEDGEPVGQGLAFSDAPPAFAEVDWEGFAKFVIEVLNALGPFIEMIVSLIGGLSAVLLMAMAA